MMDPTQDMSNVVIREALRGIHSLHGIPHPDPRMRPDRLSIRIPSTFWERLRWNLKRSQESGAGGAERALWERWLTPEVVRAILAAEVDAPSPAGRLHEAAVGIDAALRRLRETITNSLQHPLTLRIDPEPGSRPGSPSADPLYLLVLTNGATLVLRVHDTAPSSSSASSHASAGEESTPARLEDCFFSRAATNFARTAGDLAFPVTDKNPSDKNPTDARLRNAVVREWVGRYAFVAGDANSTGLVPPDRPCEFKQAEELDSISRPVHFLMPTAWGFSGGALGCRWAGFDGSKTATALGDANFDDVHRLLREQVGQRGNRRSRIENSGLEARGSQDRRGNGRATEAGTKGPGPRMTLPRYRLAWTEDAAPSFSSSPSSHPDSASPGHSTGCDALACLPELAGAVEVCHRAWPGSDSNPSTDAAAVAYELALSLGRCRLLGAEPARSADFTLAPAVALSAAGELSHRLARWSREAEHLPVRLDGATSLRASDLCLGLFESRIEAWAAYVAIDEAYSAAVEGADESAEAFSQEIDALLDGMQALDDAMQWAEPLLASAAGAPGTRLLQNWKELLAAPYRQSPPWWLDVTPECAMPLAAEEEI